MIPIPEEQNQYSRRQRVGLIQEENQTIGILQSENPEEVNDEETDLGSGLNEEISIGKNVINHLNTQRLIKKAMPEKD